VTRYLLDTAILIDFSKGWEPARSQLPLWNSSGDELGVCSINVAEFYAGISPSERARWDTVLQVLYYWDITRSAARQAGIWRYDFARRGVALSTADTLIAAVAQQQGAILVTNNVKDFPMGGVQLRSLKP
jgi:predicted nucleic acid-binding protein